MNQIHLSHSNVSELEGTGIPTSVLVPDFKGQFYRDLSFTPNVMWISVGLTNTDWAEVGGAYNDKLHTSRISGSNGSENSWQVDRTVANKMLATFEILINTRGNDPFTINNIIPQNFLGKKYFKINRVTTIIMSIVGYGGTIARTGVFTSTIGLTGVVGVGTLFLTDVKVDDLLYSGATFIGTVASITNDTNLVLSVGAAATAISQVVRVAPATNYAGFYKCSINNLMSSTDTNTDTTFIPLGSVAGAICQFEDTLGSDSIIAPTDEDNISLEYAASTPKDISSEALNFTYLANNGGSFAHGSSEGTFKVVLEGLLL